MQGVKMKVANRQIHAMQELQQRTDAKNTTQSEKFGVLLEKTKDKEESKVSSYGVTDSEVNSFLHKLTSMGASAFWLHFNLEKIQDKIEKKRDELMKEAGLDKIDDEKKVSKEVQGALQEIEAMLEDYTKELMEQIEAKKELEKSQKPSSVLASLLAQSSV